MAGLFISYAREDQPFAQQLYDALASAGRDPAWDQDHEAVPFSAPWRAEIRAAIQNSDKFVYVISPDSLDSGPCDSELNCALDLNKQVIPVLFRSAREDQEIPAAVEELNWILFTSDADFGQSFDQLTAALDTDLTWTKAHTRLLIRASEWAAGDHDRSLLLRGHDLRAAEAWLADAGAHEKAPPTTRQRDYIAASHRSAARTARVWQGALATGLVIALVLALVAFLQRNQARYETSVAVSGQLAAESEALDAASPVTAAQLAAAAWRVAPTPQAHDSMLDLLAQPERGILRGTPQRLRDAYAMAFSPNGRLLAVGVGDEAILWNVVTRTQIGQPMSFGGLENPVTALAFSPDGKILATDDGGAVFLWNVATQARLGSRMVYYGHPTSSLAFSPDGKAIVTLTDDGYVQLWNVATHSPIGGMTTATGALLISFGPGGRTFITAGSSAQAWNTATRRPVGPSLTAVGAVGVVAISPDGKFVATGDRTGHVQLWDLATGRPIGPSLATGGPVVRAIAFSSDSTKLAVVNEDGPLTVWDVASRTRIGAPLNAGVTPSALAFNPAGTILVSSDDLSAPVLWNIRQWHLVRGPLAIGRAFAVAFSPDATKIAVVPNAFPGRIRVWDLPSGTLAGQLPPAGLVSAEVFSGDGKMLAIAEAPNTGPSDVIRFWNSASLTAIGRPWSNDAATLVFSPDGNILATAGPPQFWNLATRTRIGRPLHLGTSGYPVSAMAFSPGGQILAAATQLGKLQLWDTKTHRPIGAPLTPTGADEMAFSPDGRELATGNKAGTAQLWRVATRSPLGPPLNAGDVDQLAFSPSGRFLATGTSQGTIQLWDTATGAPVGASIQASGPVLGLAFNASGTILTSASTNTVQLWGVGFPVRSSSLLAAACDLAGSPLTRREWHYYVPSQSFQLTCPAS